MGVVVVPVARGGDGDEVTLALIAGGEVRVLEVAPGALRGRGASPVKKKGGVAWYVVSAESIDDDGAAREAAAVVCEGLLEQL
jgi:hypothetical protein